MTGPPGIHSRLLRNAEGRLRLGWRLLLFLLLFLGIGVLGSFVAPPGLPGATLPVLAGALVAGWILLALDGRSPGGLGFHTGPAAPLEALAGVGVGIGVALVVVVLIGVAGGLTWSFRPEEVGVGAVFASAATALWLFSVPAAAEEALFRGYPLQALAEAWGAGPALIVTSTGFGLIHLSNPNVTWLGVVNIIAAGVFLGAVFLRTASLWWASGVHLGWNWAHGFLFAVPVSGLELVDNPVLEGTPHGPDWLSGGAFGPEGSAVSALVLLVASGWLWRTGRIRPGALGEGALRHPPIWEDRPRHRSAPLPER